MGDEYNELQAMIGLIPVSITQADDEIVFTFTDGSVGRFYHDQDCCERVEVEEVAGDWNNLLGHPILIADERVADDHDGSIPDGMVPADESNTWTFYTFRSIGGTVDVRWLGSSNGYYSEGVSFAIQRPRTPAEQPSSASVPPHAAADDASD